MQINDHFSGVSEPTTAIFANSFGMDLDDFILHNHLGHGQYSKVILVTRKSTGKPYAMKVMKKDYLMRKKMVSKTKDERQIMEIIHHPNIVNLHFAFQSPEKIFMFLDFCPGGELFSVLERECQLSEKSARFYAAQIVMALDTMHRKGIVYRDLKPENVLLAADGYLKVADLGFAKRGVEATSGAITFCGTPEYQAPEIILHEEYGTACDWWSLGIVLFEMLCGFMPFYDDDVAQLYDSILDDTVEYPGDLMIEAKDLIQKLLVKDPAQRLGSNEGAEEIKHHPFFAEIDWQKLYRKEVEPEFKPELENELDSRYFDSDFVRLKGYASVEIEGLDPDRIWDGFDFSAEEH
eukprot:CAMPEP_0114974802 /NCGR_PEP_ID=MMETSP0216-20121206/1730_1 /TAXON_ID=223996 /ORGANISM="Protocruzia adherens, Strain Boccale" /LENGTH=349 /DNA_ID=CAMNT_0002335481 /DNA_START=437 /DNA_END=1486 /DNA_ORIENTATION=+